MLSSSSILDAHLHLWDPGEFSYPWLPGLDKIDRSFTVADLDQECEDEGPGKFIFVECAHPTQSYEELEWVLNTGKSEPRLVGIVAGAKIEDPGTARPYLQKLSRHALVKGVRRNLQDEPTRQFSQDKDFLAGLRLVAEFGYTFDVCIKHTQLQDVIQLAMAVPELTFVLDHLGKPNIKGKIFQPWADDIQTLAALPNVVCKVSGLTTEADWGKWSASDFTPYIKHAIECFGFNRVLFGSDWPVMKLATHYKEWIDIILQSYPTASQTEWDQFFSKNSERIYHV